MDTREFVFHAKCLTTMGTPQYKALMNNIILKPGQRVRPWVNRAEALVQVTTMGTSQSLGKPWVNPWYCHEPGYNALMNNIIVGPGQRVRPWVNPG